jgi:predicted aspartyl protease
MRTKIPFRMVGGEQWLMVAKARIQGSEPLDCAIDTGASHCVLLPEVAARLGVHADDMRVASGAGRALEVRLGRADMVSVGAAVAKDVAIIVTDELRRIGRAIGHPIAGNLGHSFLGGFRMGVDYAAGMLELLSEDEPEDTRPARAELEFHLAHPSKPLIMIPVGVGGRMAQFALDTGASISVISPEIADRCAIETTNMPNLTGGGGLAVTAAAGVIAELAVGEVKLSQVHVAVAEFIDMLSDAIGTRIDGILGANVLRRFRLVIDYPRQRLRLE